MTPTSFTKGYPWRIAMLSIHSSPTGPLGTRDNGGMSVYVRELSRWLGRRGHQIDIFTCASNDVAETTLSPNVRLIQLGVAEETALTKERLPAYLPQVFRALDHYRGTRQLTYDLIHSHYWISGVVGAIAQSRWHIPHLTMFHTLGAAKNGTLSGENESDGRIAHERWLAMAADHIVVPAKRELDHLLGLYHARRSKISIVPCGVDLELFQPMAREQARLGLDLPLDVPIVLYVGRFAPLKGIERLLSAVQRLRRRFPRLQLMIVGGDGPGAETTRGLIDAARGMGIEDAVRFMGRVDQTRLPPYYCAADLLAIPSYYESFGLVVLEALACGTPVVATPVGAVETIVQSDLNGVIVAGNGTQDIADGIESILAIPAGQRAAAARVRATVDSYGWPRIASAVEDAYAALLETPGTAGLQPACTPCGGYSN